MRFNCTTEKYADLYARWFVNPGKLLDLGGLKPGERVIDLCGGTGIVATEAIRRGAANAFIVDLNPRLQTSHPRTQPSFQGPAEKVDQLLARQAKAAHGLPTVDSDGARHYDRPVGCLKATGRTCRCERYTDFDLVVCRQAIGYLDIHATARAVARILVNGGRFVFNSFVRPRWIVKRYRFHGRWFWETSGFLGRTVWHIQASRGIGIDVTRFRWYHEKELNAALAPNFNVRKIREGRSLYYVCTKQS